MGRYSGFAKAHLQSLHHAGKSAETSNASEDRRTRLRGILRLTEMERQLAGHRVTVRLGESEPCDGYDRYYGSIVTEPLVEIPFWYLVPRSSGPHPLGIFPHGHYAEHGLDYAVGQGGHRFYADLMWPFVMKALE